jgi:hypothetical protein
MAGKLKVGRGRGDEFASVQSSVFRKRKRLVAAIIGRRVNEMRFTAAKEKDAARSEGLKVPPTLPTSLKLRRPRKLWRAS